MLLLLCLLASCGGSNSAPPPKNAFGSSCLDHVKVQLFGDSTMVGVTKANGVYGVAAHTPTADLQAFFDARYGPGVVTIEDRAVPGTNTTQLVAGTDGMNLPWPQSVNADLVVINHGINDWPTLGIYEANLEQLAQAPARVVFETPNWVGVYDLSQWAQTMRDVAKEHAIPVADTFAYTTDKGALLSDDVHPTDALYSMISVNVMQPAVAGVVSKLRCEAP